MSHCAIIEFLDGKAARQIAFTNAWRGAARIWTAMFDRYVKDPSREYDTWLARPGDLWRVIDRAELPDFERAVMAATFDYAIIRREHFARFANDLRQFTAAYPDKLDHLPAWADCIEASQAEAIGFHHTSIGENPWSDNEGEPYSLLAGDKHWEVYDRYFQRGRHVSAYDSTPPQHEPARRTVDTDQPCRECKTTTWLYEQLRPGQELVTCTGCGQILGTFYPRPRPQEPTNATPPETTHLEPQAGPPAHPLD